MQQRWFQQASGPCGNMMEAMPYYGANHKLHRYKTEASVLSNGNFVLLFGHEKESVAEIAVF